MRASHDINVFDLRFSKETTLNGQFGPNGLALHDGVDSSRRRGVEYSGSYRLNDLLSFNTRLTLSQNRINQRGTRFSHVLTPVSQATEELVFTRNYFNARLAWRYQGKSWINLANTEQLPA